MGPRIEQTAPATVIGNPITGQLSIRGWGSQWSDEGVWATCFGTASGVVNGEFLGSGAHSAIPRTSMFLSAEVIAPLEGTMNRPAIVET